MRIRITHTARNSPLRLSSPAAPGARRVAPRGPQPPHPRQVGQTIFRGEKSTADDIEWALSRFGACETTMKQDPRAGKDDSHLKTPFGVQAGVPSGV